MTSTAAILISFLLINLIFSFGKASLSSQSSLQDRNAGNLKQNTTRIRYGENAPEDKSFFFAAFAGNSPGCGAAVISRKFVVTAAHCVVDGNNQNRIDLEGFRIVIAPRIREDEEYDNGAWYEVSDVLVHPNYRDNSGGPDLALFRLRNKIRRRDFRRVRIRMAKRNPEDGDSVSSVGFGGVADEDDQERLQYGTYTTRSMQFCNDIDTPPDDQESYICSVTNGFPDQKSPDFCPGDSGSPVFVELGDGKFRLVGIHSGGNGCFSEDFAGISYHTSIPVFRKLIKQALKGNYDGWNVFQ